MFVYTYVDTNLYTHVYTHISKDSIFSNIYMCTHNFLSIEGVGINVKHILFPNARLNLSLSDID